jgi:hypothetical protein
VEDSPNLGEVVLVRNGEDQSDHVEFAAGLQAVGMLESEIVFAGGGRERIGFENRLIAHGAEVEGDDVVAVEAVHGDHSRLALGLELFHDHAAGEDLVGNMDSAAVTVFAFPLADKGFEFFESGVRLGDRARLSRERGRVQETERESNQGRGTEHGTSSRQHAAEG